MELRIGEYKDIMGWNQAMVGRHQGVSKEKMRKQHRLGLEKEMVGCFTTLYILGDFRDGCTKHID